MVAFSATSLIKHKTSVLLEEIGNSCPQRDAGRRRREEARGGGAGGMNLPPLCTVLSLRGLLEKTRLILEGTSPAEKILWSPE